MNFKTAVNHGCDLHCTVHTVILTLSHSPTTLTTHSLEIMWRQLNLTHLIYIAERVYNACTHFLCHRHQTCCGCWRPGQVIAGLTSPVLWLIESYSSIFAFSYADNSQFLIVISIDLRFLPDLIGCHQMVEFKPITITIITFLASVRAVTWLPKASENRF